MYTLWFFSSIKFSFWIESTEVFGANQTHFTGFQFVFMRNGLYSTRIFFGNLTAVTSENPLWALAKSPHLTKVGGITQHVHVEQLSQVVWSASIVGLSKLRPDGCTLPLDHTPLLTLCLCWPDGSDHLLQRYWWRHGSLCVCVCVREEGGEMWYTPTETPIQTSFTSWFWNAYRLTMIFLKNVRHIIGYIFKTSVFTKTLQNKPQVWQNGCLCCRAVVALTKTAVITESYRRLA